MNIGRLAGRAPICNSRQRGVVLFIALIVMVAMSLAAIALIRSVDTTSIAIGNLAFRKASIHPANLAIEDAVAGLHAAANTGGGARITDRRADDPTQNYWSTHDRAWDDPIGVPTPLQTKAAALALQRQLPPDGAGNTITYIIERMCYADAPNISLDKSTTGTWCDMMAPKGALGATINDPLAPPLPNQGFYRVTVRVDGPRNTVSFVQAILR